MIKYSKKIRIDNFDAAYAPYRAIWSSSDSCLSFMNPEQNDINENEFTNVLIANGEFCFDKNPNITLEVYDNRGCKADLVFISENPCDDLTSEGIIQLDEFKFRIVVIGDDSPFEYDWNYPDNVFNQIGDLNSSFLNLEQIQGETIPSKFEISVTITDQQGCSRTFPKLIELCVPQPEELNQTAFCSTGSLRFTSRFELPILPCPNTQIDWSTLELTSAIDVKIFRQTDEKVILTAPAQTPSGTYDVFWTVKDTNGQLSKQGKINLVLEDCDDEGGLERENQLKVKGSCNLLVCEDVENYPFTKTLDVEDKIIPFDPDNVDWGTFEFIPNELQNVNSQGVLVTQSGTVTFTANRELIFEFTNDFPQNRAMIARWRIKDKNGNWSNIATDTWVYNCLSSPPTANTIDICVNCNGRTIIDPLKNDTGEIDRQSIIITRQPSFGTATINNDGTITYATTYKQNGTVDTLKYKVANFNGDYSEEAVVQLQMICIGTTFDSLVQVSQQSPNYDLRSNVPNVVPGGIFTLLEAPNGHTLGENGQCDLTWDEAIVNYYEQPSGNYVWQYTYGIQLCEGTFDDCTVTHVFTNTVNKS